MKPSKVTIFELFEKERRYVVPLFQRPYVWTVEKQWMPLWEDISAKANEILEFGSGNESIGTHFLGAAVLNTIKTFGKQVTAQELIDGQQRLTTLQIVLLALRDFLTTAGYGDYKRLLNKITLNDCLMEQPVEQYKVWPTTSDRTTFTAIFEAGSPEALRAHFKKYPASNTLLADAYHFFYDAIDEYVRFGENDPEVESPEYTYDSEVAAHRIEAIIETIRKYLEIVVIELEDRDDPQIIFETLNARGEPLLPSDLMRNFVFLEAMTSKANVEELYANYWVMFDDYKQGQAQFWKAEERQGRLTRPRIDLFMFHFLTLKTEREIKLPTLFQEFRRWWSQQRRTAGVEECIAEIHRYARLYHQLMIADTNTRLGLFVYRLKSMDTSTLYPILMLLYGELADMPDEEREGIITDLESYLVRRMVSGLSAKNYNQFFLNLLREIRRAARVDRQVIQEILLGYQADTSRWPGDEEFYRAWLTYPVYRRLVRARVRMLLEALDIQMLSAKQEILHINSKLSIEHVFPQSPEDGHWPLLNEPDSIHTLGNLTLLTQQLNSAISNGAFTRKRPEIAKQSLLPMNSMFQTIGDSWTEEHIIQRGQQLFEIAQAIWPRPLTPEPVAPSGDEQAATIEEICLQADQNGIGEAFRVLLLKARDLGFHPRPYSRSIMYTPPSDKGRMLFTAWTDPDKAGFMRIYVGPEVFAEFFDIKPEEAVARLGEDGYRKLDVKGAEDFAEALQALFSET